MIGANKKLMMGAAGGVVPSGSISFTSPGTYFWTAPSGVTSINNLQGRGGSNTTTSVWNDYDTGANKVWVNGPSGGQSTKFPNFVGSTLSFATVNSALSTIASGFNSISTSGQSYNGLSLRLYYLWTDLNWYFEDFPFGGWTVRRVGTFNTSYSVGSGNVSVPTAGIQQYSVTGAKLQRFETTTVFGTNSTAFGATYSPGGGTVTTGTVTGIVPGQTYTIVVGINQASAASFVSFSWGN